MKYRLHLNADAQLKQMYDEAKAALSAHAFGKGARVLGHSMLEGEAGILYITVSDLAPDVSSELAPFVARVTVLERIYTGFRTEGIYELDGAKTKLWLRNNHQETGSGFDYQTRDCQDIEITAPTIEAARTIYEAVRTGALKPVKDFEAGALDVQRTAERAFGTADEV